MKKILTAISIFLLVPGIAFASADRVALVVGISSYEHVPELKNPVNDLKVMRQTLLRLGFDVVSAIDVSKSEFETKIEQFRVKMRNSKVALFYYAGHGLQVNGKNYLIPRDASLPDLASVEKQSIEFDGVIAQMEQMSQTNLVFLDACRNNPLSRRLSRAIGDGGSRSIIGTGLASVQVGKGTLVTYSTQPGNVAIDGSGINSPFTSSLAKWMNEPGLEVRQMLSRVRKDVLSATYGQQVPWDHSSMTGDFYFATGGKSEAETGLSKGDEAKRMWSFISQSNDLAMFDTFVKTYPTSKFAPFAVAKIRTLKGSQIASINSQRPSLDMDRDRKEVEAEINRFLEAKIPRVSLFHRVDLIKNLMFQHEELSDGKVTIRFEAEIEGQVSGQYVSNTIAGYHTVSGTLTVRKNQFGTVSVGEIRDINVD